MFCTIFPQILSLEIILKQAETIAPMLLPKKPCSNELRNILVELQTVKFAKKNTPMQTLSCEFCDVF